MKSIVFPGTCALLLTCSPLAWAQKATPAPPASRAAADSPSSIYLQGHLLRQEAEDKEKAGDFAGAYFKYKDARELFEATHSADPSWQTEMVDQRRERTANDMERVRVLEKKRRASGGEVSLSGVIGDPAAADGAGQPRPGTGPRNTSEVMEERMRGLQDQIDKLAQRNEEVVKKMGEREAELRASNKARLESSQSEKSLRESLADAQAKIQTAGVSEKRRNETLTKRVTELEGQLKDSVEKLSAVNDKNSELLADLEKAYGEIKQRTQERDDLKQERDQMEALLSGDGGKGLEKLKILADNKRLRTELESAQIGMKRLQSEKTADQTQIAALREQLQGVQEELTKFNQENEDYRQQIAALTSRLDETKERLGVVAEGAVPEAESNLENRVLRSIILQQLKQQSKREAAQNNVLDDLAREGVLDRMKEMGVETDKLMRSLHEMAMAVPLSKEQRSALSSSRLEKYLTDNGVGDLLMTQDLQELRNGSPVAPAAASGPGEPDADSGVHDKATLSPEMKAYANAAEEMFQQQDYSSAESQFQKILVVDPMNVYALTNLGVVQLRMGNYEAARLSIMRAQAYDYTRGASHYLLGVTYMRLKQMDKAVEEIEIGLQLDPENANAHLTLGEIARQSGELSKAEREWKQAIAINSSCAVAHFNLAVLYAGDEKKFSLARKHYQLALRNGSDRDSRLDNLLGS